MAINLTAPSRMTPAPVTKYLDRGILTTFEHNSLSPTTGFPSMKDSIGSSPKMSGDPAS